MKFLVVESLKSVRDSLCYILLSFGIKGIPIKNYKSAEEYFDNNQDITGLIVDIDNKDVEGIKLIEYLRGNNRMKDIKIIVHTIQSNKDFVIKMIELGVAGYLLKPFAEEQAYRKLENILNKLSNHHKDRKHIRVKPEADELLRLHFKLPGHEKLLSGKILDISMGGVAAELFNPPENKILTPGTSIPAINFVLSTRQLSPSGDIVLQKGNFIAIKFKNMGSKDKNNLARFIFKRISQ